MKIKKKSEKKLSRAEKSDEIRRNLFSAAAQVVGEVGYMDASIVRITQMAGTANGTFYNYFESRQELFDQLLPSLGIELLDFITARLSKTDVGLERERLRIEAYFDYLADNPWFYRILNEAEVFAPKAYYTHLKIFCEGYVRALKRAKQRGEITRLEDGDMVAAAHMLFGARAYLTLLWKMGAGDNPLAARKKIIDSYMKFVEGALFI